MFHDLTPYPKASAEGLPARWQQKRLRSIASMLVSNIDKKTSDDEVAVRLCNYLDVYRNGVITPDLGFMRATATAEEVRRYGLRCGDVVITKDSESWLDIGVPALVAAEAEDLVYGYHLAVLRPTPLVLGPYLYLVMTTPMVASQLHVAANGVTRFGLGHGAIKATVVPVPPVEEQQSIITYLSHAHRRINRAIATKRRLIALLAEEQLAVLDSLTDHEPEGEQPMLGQMLSKIEQGWSPTAVEGLLSDEQWAVLSLSAVNFGQFNPEALKPLAGDLDVPASLTVRDGDLLLTRSNTRQRVGDVAIARGVRPRTIFSDLIYRLTPRDLLDARYLVMILRSRKGRAQIEIDARGSSNTMPKISQAHIRRWRVPLLPLATQRTLVARFDHMTARIARKADLARREIDLLQEYRSRLTADIVTGKLDVRDIAKTLPPIDPAEAFAESVDTVGEDGEEAVVDDESGED